MQQGRAIRKLRSAAVALLTCIAATGCEMRGALAPRGTAAAQIADLWWILFWVALAVTLIVFGLLATALVRARRARPGRWSRERSAGFVLVGGAIVPAVILVGATLLTFGTLAPFDRPPADDALTIDVTGHTFWWEAVYEEDGFATANEIHIPVGRPVRLRLESADVIHSFWVPEIAGKLEMVPGWTNVLYIEADEAGTYVGRCAEFCGTQHANMEFLVVAQPEEDFDAWRQGQLREAAEPDDQLALRGRDVFLAEPCALCHTIRGVNHATTDVGPDLTHVASRRTLAARTVPNTRGGLAGWIADPQGVKPGNHMPAVNLDSEELLALVAYLGSLE